MRKRVLIVDDDQFVLLGILAVQKRLGYEIEVANSSRQALEKIRASEPFHVVVSDWDMPGMDGLEFLRRCREQSPGMVRLMLSGNPECESIQQAIREKLLLRFIPKPCTPHQLALHLSAALPQHRPLPAGSC